MPSTLTVYAALATLAANYLTPVLATTCDQSPQLRIARMNLKNDQDALRKLRPGSSSIDLEQWATDSEEKRSKVLRDAFKNAASALLDGLLDAPKSVLEPMNIAGYDLPNGLASIGTGQANAIIGRLRSQGITEATPQGRLFMNAIRRVGSISGKRGTLEHADDWAHVFKDLKAAAELEDADDPSDSIAAVFQLAAAAAGVSGFSLSVGNALFSGSKNLLDAYVIASAVQPLDKSSTAQLQAVQSLSKKLERDVAVVRKLKEACSTDGDQGSGSCPGKVVHHYAHMDAGVGLRKLGGGKLNCGAVVYKVPAEKRVDNWLIGTPVDDDRCSANVSLLPTNALVGKWIVGMCAQNQSASCTGTGNFSYMQTACGCNSRLAGLNGPAIIDPPKCTWTFDLKANQYATIELP